VIDSTIRLTGQGYTVNLTDSPEQLHRRPGGAGWGMAPVANSWFEGAGDGARLRSTRRTQRELTIPIDVLGNSRQDIENNIRSLVQIIREPFLVHVDRTSGESFYIEAVYESGLEGVYTTAPEYWNQVSIVLKCPDPYWTSEAVQQLLVAPVPAPYPFVQRLAALPVASSAAFGQVSIENSGDVESKPTWTIHGPGTGVTLSIAGNGLVLNRTLTSANTITIQHNGVGWTIVDETGANQYPNLATTPAPVFPTIPRGTSLATVSMANTDANSFIRAVYPERREVVY
jgi:phage-related protein